MGVAARHTPFGGRGLQRVKSGPGAISAQMSGLPESGRHGHR